MNSTTYNSILDTFINGPRGKGVTFSQISAGAGSSNTLLLAHKALRPMDYPGKASNQDQGYDWTYYTTGGGYDHMRWADTFGNGYSAHKGYTPDHEIVDEKHCASAHSGGAPVLFADGSVHNFTYGYSNGGLNEVSTWQALWAFNRTIGIAPPQ